jgi:uncharacterized protein with ParB-like and HNH nuclease domain
MPSKDIPIKLEADDPLPFIYSITSYGADYDVDGWVKRLDRNDIYIPSFQRAYVWNLQQASRFIESLLLGLPVPGVFLSKEHETNKHIVIDGQQRLKSLLFFYNGVFEPTGKEFLLTGLNRKSRFYGKKYRSLSPEDKRLLDDSIIHATIIRQDEPDDGNSSIYLIFERLNTGGTQLQPQEIRTAIFHGEFNRTLDKLNENLSWRELYGKISPRKRDVELILRFLALYNNGNNYEKPMKGFLNDFMGLYRNLDQIIEDQFSLIFSKTVKAIYDHLGSKAFKPKRSLNAAICDSLMIGVANRLVKGEIKDEASFQRAYVSLLEDSEYERATQKATTNDENVRKRLKLAKRFFQDVI